MTKMIPSVDMAAVNYKDEQASNFIPLEHIFMRSNSGFEHIVRGKKSTAAGAEEETLHEKKISDE